MNFREQLHYVARLARIYLGPEELEYLSGQLEVILGYVEKLKTVDVLDAAPMSHVLELENVFREDVPEASLGPQEALGSAPDKEGNYFKVPPVIE